MITTDDFKKLEIKIGKIISAEKVVGADKLLKLIFDIGGEERQIISGLTQEFPDPSVLVGREMPVLLNLEPATFKGQTSYGMILAVDVAGKPILLHPAESVPAGSVVR